MKRKKSFSVVLIITIVIIIVTLGFVASLIGFKEFTSVLEKQYNDSAYEIAETVRSTLNADRLEEYLETGVKDDEYNRIEADLDRLVVNMNCNYIYVARLNPDNLLESTYIFDSVNPWTGFDRYPLGYVATDMDPKYTEDTRRIMETGGRAEKYLYTYTATEAHTTAALGVTDSSGRVVALVCVEKPMSILVAARNTYVRDVVLAVLAIIAITIILYILFLRVFLVQPIREITDEAVRFAEDHSEKEGELKAAKNRYEIGSLARSIRKMEGDINEYIKDLTKVTAEKERIGAELNVATQIQADMLPRIFPAFPDHNEFELFATMNPAKEVGGDFYDYFLVDHDHLALVMADVSGKGVPAALFMVIAKTLIKNSAQNGNSPSEILAYANEQLNEGNEAELFVTVWLAIIEISTGKGIAANAGHEAPVLKRAGGKYELQIYKHSPAVATIDGIRFRQHEFEIFPGDDIFVYTDGVPEATNANEELYGNDRMLDVLNRNLDASPQKLLAEVRADIEKFVGDAPQFDDITMLSFHYYGPGHVPEEENNNA
ncbi:MAG: PP2C family protein-serine/threonine phosphatase [Lachnospiraceae bacterium]|nr:PP2C family protein-serine/threonine phosphatase [Lachnospiraceae bacterium]